MKLKFLFLPLLLTVTMMLEGCESLVEAAYLFEENAAQEKLAEEIPIPTNVILVVGDGMGVAQVYSSVVAQGGGRLSCVFRTVVFRALIRATVTGLIRRLAALR